jgi:hypothetical protein
MDQVFTVQDLLADPVRFDGQIITVIGFYVGESEHHALHRSRAHVGTRSNPRLSEAVWLHHEATVGGEKKAERLNRHRVRVTGIFHNRRRAGAGHFNAFPAFISGITAFDLDPTEDRVLSDNVSDKDRDT